MILWRTDFLIPTDAEDIVDTVFLLGAGFSSAANSYLRPEDRGACGPYPLAADLTGRCFDTSYDLAEGVEQAFQAAADRRDHRPFDVLVDLIQGADYCPGRRAASDSLSALRLFLDQRPASTYLTFNYDCLLEQALLRAGLWYPLDGFGVTADVSRPASVPASLLERRSSSKVIHLHGSLYLYAREFDVSSPDKSGIQWHTLKDVAEFVFDPDANASLFLPFEKGHQDLRYKLPPERIIAPVPDKAAGLAEKYIRVVYDTAKNTLDNCQELVAIGYSFGETDRASYTPLLELLHSRGGPGLKIVTPNADHVARRVAAEYPKLKVAAFAGTFEHWVAAGYP